MVDSILTWLRWKVWEIAEGAGWIGKVLLAIIRLIIAIVVGIARLFLWLFGRVWWLIIHVPDFLKWLRRAIPAFFGGLWAVVVYVLGFLWESVLPGAAVLGAIYALGWVIPALDATSLTKWCWRAAVPFALWSYWNILAVSLRGKVIAESGEEDDIASDAKRLRNACLMKAAEYIVIAGIVQLLGVGVVALIAFAWEALLALLAVAGLWVSFILLAIVFTACVT